MIFIISGPSGVGKGTLVEKLIDNDQCLHLAKSTTTRERREKEVAGIHYEFVGRSEFTKLIREGEFAEWAEIYGELYGTRVSELRTSTGDLDIILEIDYKGAQQIKERRPSAKSIFILPPSFLHLEERIKGRRSNESREQIARRVSTAAVEIQHAHQYDYWVVNDYVDRVVPELQELIKILRSGGTPEGTSFRNPVILAGIWATFPAAV